VKREGASRVTWEIEPIGDPCRLIVTHDQLRDGANDELYGGWPQELSGHGAPTRRWGGFAPPQQTLCQRF
jgi:hypothetical protein